MKWIEKINLKDKQKSDLIQTLLIVSSILVALKTQDSLSAPFMIFTITSIIYYIFIQNDKFKHSIWSDFIVLIIAATFSILVNVNLFVSFGSALINFSPSLGLFFYYCYYLLLTLILWAALVKR